MNRTTRPALALGAGLALATALVGCSGGGEPQEDFVPGGGDGQPDDPIAADDCLIGDWLLDVEDYRAQAEAYLLGLGIPISDFAMDGTGILAVAGDGTIQVNVDLTTSTTLAGQVAVSVPSSYTASGTWSRPESDVDAIRLEGFPEAGAVEGEVPIPVLDYSGTPRVTVMCDDLGDDDQAGTVRLQEESAPISALWVRTN
ncbi:MAG: hypothetical protein J0G30_07550 [Actinomycetales bacterium]|nr:hypothetical protein [Actinomycetales bacterium]